MQSWKFLWDVGKEMGDTLNAINTIGDKIAEDCIGNHCGEIQKRRTMIGLTRIDFVKEILVVIHPDFNDALSVVVDDASNATGPGVG